MRYAVVVFVFLFISLFGIEEVYLKTPDLSRANIIGTNVGIRPYRKSGVRIETETIQNKRIIHNYGYGGSGLTLCLGGAQEVLDILSVQKVPFQPLAILGGGFAGLSTAYTLLEHGYEVRIYADEWSPHLTSNVAAGIWSPLVLSKDVCAEKKNKNERMLQRSRDRFLKSVGEYPEFAGVRFIDSYSFKKSGSEEAIQTKHQGEEVLVHFDNGITKVGRKFKELGIDGKIFMEDLFAKVKAKGAVLIQRRFDHLEDILSLQEETIINCTSMGSRELFNDIEFIPVRGQMIYFKNDVEMDCLLYQNVPNSKTLWVSIYPWKDRLILGGIYEHGEEEAIIVPEVLDKILKNAEDCLSGQL